jgi:Dullard-like phosphatase family protein
MSSSSAALAVASGRLAQHLLLLQQQPRQPQPTRRCQSSHALTSAPATRSSNNNNSSSSKEDVKPWLRQYRPQVNGRTVAFHISDLLKQPASSPPSLPPPVSQSQQSSTNNTKRQYESDLVVILDMDECMIHSQFLSSPDNAQVYAHQVMQQRQRRNGISNNTGDSGENNASVCDHFRVHLPSTGDLVHVNVRPGLKEFLQNVTSRYETHVFTAAMSVYARPVLQQLDPTGEMFANRIWYREHCRYDAHHNAYLKDLEALPVQQTTCPITNNSTFSSINLNRTVLIDNNPLSFITHPENGILVSSFYNDASDNTLPAVFDLLQELESYPDVRPVLDRRFGLKTALLGHTSNSSSSNQQQQQQQQQAMSQQQQRMTTKATTTTTTSSNTTASSTATAAAVPLASILKQQQRQQVVAALQQQAVAAF